MTRTLPRAARALTTTGPIRLVAMAVLALAVPLLWAAPASAHAGLVSSTPENGARLDTLPAEVSLTFNEEISEPAYVVVTAPDGSRESGGDPEVSGDTVTQQLTGDQEGTYIAAYRVVSEDGHPVTGRVEFSVGSGSASGASSAGSEATDSGEQGAGDPSSPADARADESTTEPQGFWGRHGTHVIIGAALFVVAAALLYLSRRSARSRP